MPKLPKLLKLLKPWCNTFFKSKILLKHNGFLCCWCLIQQLLVIFNKSSAVFSSLFSCWALFSSWHIFIYWSRGVTLSSKTRFFINITVFYVVNVLFSSCGKFLISFQQFSAIYSAVEQFFYSSESWCNTFFKKKNFSSNKLLNNNCWQTADKMC